MLSFSATFQCSLCIQQLLCASLIEWKPVSLLNLLFIFCYPFTCLVGTLAGLSAVPLVQRDIICDNHVTTSSLFLAWDRKKNRVSFGSCRTHQQHQSISSCDRQPHSMDCFCPVIIIISFFPSYSHPIYIYIYIYSFRVPIQPHALLKGTFKVNLGLV